MLARHPLRPPEIDPAAPPEVLARLDAFDLVIPEVEGIWASVARSAEYLDTGDLGDLVLGGISEALVTEFAEATKAELDLRRELDGFAADAAKAHAEMREAAILAVGDARAAAEAELRAIGYQRETPGAFGYTPWLPGMISTHPRIGLAERRSKDLAALADVSAYRRANAEAIADLERRLAVCRGRLFAPARAAVSA